MGNLMDKMKDKANDAENKAHELKGKAEAHMDKKKEDNSE